MTFLIKKQYSIFATRISWADFNDIERKFKNSSEPYLDQLFLTKKDASPCIVDCVPCVWKRANILSSAILAPYWEPNTALLQMLFWWKMCEDGKCPIPGLFAAQHLEFPAGLWIRIRIRIGSVFNEFVDPDLDWESGSKIRIQGQENEEK
jgi:hypothetical protein